ncbi:MULTISPECIES: hypothetical protein [Sorangium]|uniref:Secreted protein n=1 Tax=Sorangium cellulosum TaxID=56 RepID=A0A4P2QQG2_SORCE|nr:MULTISPECIES: hypothetical protein [Sorangium]AUX31753.1 uncharacterized protein SOCE836_038840 [Sorangium cellulosum]WCQ91131.1 hypothetical protein NQZ70_03846 [Sorangium sp. Soce836]
MTFTTPVSSARFSAPLGALALAALSLWPAAARAQPVAPMHGAHSVPAPGGASGPPQVEAAPAILSAPKLPATSGPRALAGLAWIRAAVLGVRLDVGWQLPLTNVIALRGYLASMYSYDSVSLPDLGGLMPEGELEIHELALLATADIDAAIFSTEQGRLAAGGGLGMGPSFAWVRMPDMPFQPGEWAHASAVIGRLSGHLEYRFPSGWVLRGQPFGLLFSGQENADTAYEMAFMGGYQW